MTQAAASGQQLSMSSASLPPPKTREDVIALLEEIRIFSQLPVPFRLGDLHEKDCLIEDGGDGRQVVAEREKRPPSSPLTTQITAVVGDAASKSPSKSPPKQQQQHDQQGKSYARLMFNFPSTGSGKSRSIRLPPEIKPTQVMKMIQVKREKGGMKAKRSTIITTFKKAPPSPGKQMLPPCADFFSRMNSCRAINSMKAKLQLKLQLEAEEQAKKRRAPATRTRNRQNLPPPPPLPSSNSNSPLLIPFTAYNPLLETPPPSCKSSFDCSMSSSGDEVGLGDEVFSPMSNLSSSSSSAEIISAVAESSPMPDATESSQQQPAKQAEDDLFLDLANVDFEGFDEVFPTTTSNDLQQQDFLAEWLNDGIPLSPPLTTPPPHY